MVKENIKKHDQLSFEAKLEFPANVKVRKVNDFNVNIFLFLPYGLDINKHNFTREDFYNSLKTSIRLTTPSYKLSQMIEGENSPYSQLLNSIKSILSISNTKTQEEYEKQTKSFCSIFKVALRNKVNDVIRTHNIENKRELISEYKKHVISIRSYFIALNKKFNNLKSNDNTQHIYKYADEYQSLVVEKHTATIIKSLSKQKTNYSDLIKLLEEIIIGEMDYRSIILIAN